MGNRISVSECPHCGAPVDVRAISDPVNPSCPWCHTLLPTEAPPSPPAVFTPFNPAGASAAPPTVFTPFNPTGASAAPPTVFTPFGASTQRPGGGRRWRRRRSHVGLVILAVAVVWGGSQLFSTIRAGHTTATSATYEIEGLPVLASPGTSSTDAYVVAADEDATGTPVVRRVKLSSEKTVWSSGGLPSAGGGTPALVAGADRVVAVLGTHLVGLDSSTGAHVWESSIENDLASSCTECAAIVGADLVTIAEDGTVQGHVLASGKPLWSRHLPDTPDALQAVGGDVSVFSSAGRGVYQLLLFDPSNGDEHTIAPQCAPDGEGDQAEPMTDSPYSFNSAGTEMTILIDGSGGCVATYSLATGALVWRTAPDPENSQVPFTLTGESAVSGGGVLAWTNEVGADTWLFDVNLSGGPIRQLFKVGNEGGTTNLDGVVGQSLVFDYAPSYASEQPAVYAVDVSSGRQLWTHRSFVTSEESDGSQSVVTTADAVVVVYCSTTADDLQGTCVYNQFEPTSGRSAAILTIDDIGPDPTFDFRVGPTYILANLNSDLVALYEPSVGNGVGYWPPS